MCGKTLVECLREEMWLKMHSGFGFNGPQCILTERNLMPRHHVKVSPVLNSMDFSIE
jgi:hypothetical protein